MMSSSYLLGLNLTGILNHLLGKEVLLELLDHGPELLGPAGLLLQALLLPQGQQAHQGGGVDVQLQPLIANVVLIRAK